MSLRQHLIDHHANETDHHVRRAKSCVKLADRHDAMSKCMSLGADVRQHHEEMRDCYKEMGAEHVRMSEHHIAKCKACSTMDLGEEYRGKVTKIASDAERFARDVDGVAGVHPEMPERLRLVPRSGDLADLAKTQAEENLAAHPAFARRTA